MERYDVAVLGGGLLGCFMARELRRYPLKVALVEAREDVCTGISRANTAIVYTGCDTKPGTLKTRLCVEANRGFDALCRELGVPFSRKGSLMVSYGPRADRVLQDKLLQGMENGVEGLRLLSGREAEEWERGLAPGVSSALYAPGTGVSDPWGLCYAAWENALANGVAPWLGAPVTDLLPEHGGWRVVTLRGELWAAAVVNCCGLHADQVQELAAPPSVRISPEKADYLMLDEGAGNYVGHVIFHEPEEKGKGLTLVPTLEGKLLVGPTEEGAAGPQSATTTVGLDKLRQLAAQVVPQLDLGLTIRSFAGVRPRPYSVVSARSIHDFTITNPARGLWSLIGIKTPGLTCAQALGAWLAPQVADTLGRREPDPTFRPERKAPVRPRSMSREERAVLVARDPAYGRILCRCGGITEGEVRDAIRRGAVTLDGVKRRVGTGLGRCQGSFCTDRVMDLLSRMLGVPPQDLWKDGPGSRLLTGGRYGEG